MMAISFPACSSARTKFLDEEILIIRSWRRMGSVARTRLSRCAQSPNHSLGRRDHPAHLPDGHIHRIIDEGAKAFQPIQC